MLMTMVSPRDKISARAALRRACDAAHQRMHGLKPFAEITAGTLPITDYHDLLRSLYLYHSAVGHAAQQSGSLDVSSATQRLALLRSDIACLGGTVPVPVIDWQPGGGEALLGALYVAEGSMLGGRVIARQLDYLFGARREGRSFFIGNKCDNANFSRLVLLLEDRCANPAALHAAISGANCAFDWFELCVTDPKRASRKAS